MNGTMRWIAGLAGAAMLALAGFYLASPYWAIHQVRSAASDGDHRTISDHIDFPAVRESLRGQIMVAMGKQMNAPEMKDNPFAGLGAAIAAAMVGPLVDAFVTPQAIAEALRQGRMNPAGREPGSRGGSAGTGQAPTVEHRYEGLDRFVVVLKPDDARGKGQLELVMRRRGVFQWQLTDIVLPLDEIMGR